MPSRYCSVSDLKAHVVAGAHSSAGQIVRLDPRGFVLVAGPAGPCPSPRFPAALRGRRRLAGTGGPGHHCQTTSDEGVPPHGGLEFFVEHLDVSLNLGQVQLKGRLDLLHSALGQHSADHTVAPALRRHSVEHFQHQLVFLLVHFQGLQLLQNRHAVALHLLDDGAKLVSGGGLQGNGLAVHRQLAAAAGGQRGPLGSRGGRHRGEGQGGGRRRRGGECERQREGRGEDGRRGKEGGKGKGKEGGRQERAQRRLAAP
eukprot:GHVT01071614.1.p1 GENE.GHVT01071614.1~~GHVT01071614.1.p1  ORF type:complete len:257 (-),score=52.69 GHVT01071614.1:195-965(-)